MNAISLREKIINAVIIGVIVSITVAMPVMAKTSKWSMTLYYGVCDGYKNGVCYTADKGDDIEVTGTVSVVSKDSDTYDESTSTYCIVYRKQLIGYEKIDSQKLDTFEDIGDECDIDISTEATKDSKKYYLYFYKSGDDGYNLEGSGEISID